MDRTRLLAAASALAVAAGAPAFAQDAAPEDDAVERIVVVSTQKRDELATEVPITITAYEQETLDLLGVRAFDELSDFTPGLIVQLQSPNNPGFVIRGITSDNGNFQDPPRVSTYLNGVDVSRSRGSAFELFDLERVEVVKGPQATLFGTAASVGAISVVTAKPQKEFAGGGYAEFGNFNAITLGGFVTGGNDILQGRLAAQLRERDGFIENLAGTDRGAAFSNQDDLQGIGAVAVRPSLRFTPNDALTVDFVFNYERNDTPGTAFKSGVIAPPGGTTSPFTAAELGGAFGNPQFSFEQVQGILFGQLDPFTTAPAIGDREIADLLGSDELGLEREVFDYNLTATWELGGGFSLTGIVGYREFDSLEVFDADGSQVPLVEASEDTEGEQQSYELRVNYDRGGRFRGFAGVSYFQEDGFQRAPFALDETIFAACLATNPQTQQLAVTPVCVNPDGSFNRLNPLTGQIVPAAFFPGVFYPAEFTNFGDHETFSAFADLTTDITDRLEFTAGLRVINEERESSQANLFPDSALFFANSLPDVQAGLLPGPIFTPLLQGFANTNNERVTESLDETALLPRFNVKFDVTDAVNVYGSIARGRRSPVFSIVQTGGADNPFAPMDVVAPSQEIVDEEIVWNYETGLKSVLFGGLAQIDAAVFYQDYSNFRVQITDIAAGGIRNESAGDAGSFGVEAGATVYPADGLTLLGTFAYIDAEIDDDASNGDFAGNQFRLQPEFSGSFTANYRRPLFGLVEGFGTLSYIYRSEVFFEADNNPLFRQDEVNLVNVRVGVAEAQDLWQVSVFADNVFDENYLIDAGNTGQDFGSPTFIAGPPLLWGVELRTQF